MAFLDMFQELHILLFVPPDWEGALQEGSQENRAEGDNQLS